MCKHFDIQGTKMERLYAELSEYYVFDKLKYTLEEFFGDIKTFKDQFKQVGLVCKVILVFSDWFLLKLFSILNNLNRPMSPC